MVQFNKKERTFTITFSGCEEDYMNYCRSLARIIAIHNPEYSEAGGIYDVATLLEAMLPASEQNIRVE